MLLHMVPTSTWSGSPLTGSYEAPSLAGSDGYIHLSTPEQVHIPANLLYAERTDLLLLCIDQKRLSAPIKWEAGFPEDPDSMLFPHLYGPLNLDAVFDVIAYRPAESGKFLPPPDLPAEPD